MTLRVALNITSCVKSKPTGIANYIRALLAEFAEAPPEIRFRLGVRFQKFSDRGLIEKIPRPAGRIRLLMRPFALTMGRNDIVHSLGTWLPGGPSRFHKVVTVHDIVSLDDPEAAGLGWAEGRARKIRETLEKADFVIVPSEFTRQRLVERLGVPAERMRAIHHAVDVEDFRTPPEAQQQSTLAELGIDGPFLLAPADSPSRKKSGAFRKNSAELIRAFGRSKAREDGRLVLFGAQRGPTEAMTEAMREHGVEARVRLLSYVSHDQLLALYASARAFFFPSLYEGFGIPLLEAMAMGVPVATSSTTSLPEVGGDCAVYFDPRNAEEIAHGIDRLWSDDALCRDLALRGRRRAASFTWKKAADETISVYRELTGR